MAKTFMPSNGNKKDIGYKPEREIIMSKEIIIHGKAIAEANGTHLNKNSKAVFCLETGEIFASNLDAALAKGVTRSTMSAHCTGKTRHCNGQHFFHVSKATENLNLVAMHLRNLATENAKLKVKADLYDAWQAELEAERRAEEEEKQRRLLKQKQLEEMTSKFIAMEAEIKALREELCA